MTCDGCVNSMTKALKGVAGARNVDVSLKENQATVTYDEGKASVEALKKAIEDAGFDTL